jgi:hypothetical protein
MLSLIQTSATKVISFRVLRNTEGYVFHSLIPALIHFVVCVTTDS